MLLCSSSNGSGYEFGITTVTEVFMVKEKSVIWIVAYNLSVYINIGEQWEHVIIAFYECMLFFVLSVMVLAFVHVYGEREYVVDLAQLYPIKDGYRPWTSPAHPVHLRIFEVVTFLFLILMVLSFVYTLGPNRVQGLSTLFFVTPEHPSYWRITALAGVEEAAFTEEVQ
ncbi:hypothetical protein NECAME_06354 [Necator americanus]|uniref:Uncharacterized protein n=1 Tax=Necator americanus TaxID=51031 RepID=W2TWT6_NECAM|nr:hypothetical protein NECAME_06354 [Necator americanus]ETN85487.1 hypothetical protein NECAME_06354 [Necator americanus]